ncbi:hypothetical protein [Nocardioides sp.]|uniref:hypothetical protein n=1 Tax=Nocardioides sp. TaxID=35761 RepID=UPI00272523D1|nr:hypothetical protein [Nocardioides sp.]MDO9456980.1 hypothetical protein [Nocardioides sp.]
MSLVPTRPRARVAAVAAVVGVALLFLSPVFGRAAVSGQYRPLLPADGLTTGCYPLPGGVVPDFPYVLRHDGDTVDAAGIHRRVVLHFDRVDAAEAVGTIEDQLAEAGVADGTHVEARDFEDVPDDAVVRGEMVLDLPSIGVQSDDPVCDDPNSTKRFTPDLLDRS